MKAMKKVISTVLLICMLAALLSVSAFAATPATSVTVRTTHSEYKLTDTGNVTYTATLNSSDADNVSTIEWYLNGKSIFTSSVSRNADGTLGASISLTPGELKDGTNTILAKLLKDGQPVRGIDGSQIQSSVETYKQVGSRESEVKLDCTNCTLVKDDSIWLHASGKQLEGGELKDFTGNDKVTWSSSNSNVVTVDKGKITAVKAGTATITAKATDGSVAEASCTVSVVEPTKTVVTISPIVTVLKKGQTITLEADVSMGTARFSHWRVINPSGLSMSSYVNIGNENSERTTLTAIATTPATEPIRLYAYADDGACTYIEFDIVDAAALQIEASPMSIVNGQTCEVYVVNPMANEEFNWSITPTSGYGVLSRSNKLGSKIQLTAGPNEGSIQVVATSKNDSNRTASVTISVNREASYGSAWIKPSAATWTPGQGDLVFQVGPSFYAGYVDSTPLTSSSGYYTYWNGVLTIKTSLLRTLSTGEHSLKVYTSSNNGIDGLIYATIYVNGSASSVYGDNTHVRGSSYNLYFNSTDPIKEVYISNQWIDPANYSVDSTGKRLTLNANFLNQLGYGTYTMKLSTQNGYTETANFRIVTANYAPATGDNSNLGAWTALMLLSCVGAVVLIPRKKKSTDLVG